MSDTRQQQIPQAAIDALKRGNKIEAIKLTRAATGMGLKESKEAVEALVDNDADVRASYESKANTLNGAGLVKLVANLLIIAAVVYFVFFRR